MDLILCHTTADFDTLGAAVGLTCLQPGARIVLTGGMHSAVRDFLALHRDEYALIERRSVNPEQVRSLTVVDTQSRSRLGKAAEWLDLPNVEIAVYDHHQGVESDIPASQVCIENVGAATTLVVEQLQQQGLVPSAIAATVMALGIHVDTGSLTFDHATPRDARALAWLMEQGASLRAIADYIDPGLSPELRRLLTIALDELQTEALQGYTVAWVLLNVDEFIPGLSSLASRLVDLTNIDALLLAARYGQTSAEEGDSLSLIGRSRIDGTDLSELFKPLGGGGHPRAAAANIHQVDAENVLANLVSQLKAQLPQPPTARELMSSPVRTIRPETTIDEAQRILLRYGHSGLSVVDTDRQLVGVISRRDLDIALHHGFSHAPVKGYMTTNLKTIAPETLLPDIESLMVTYDIGRLPVLDNGQLVGIVTRTDVLRQLHRRGVKGQGSGVRGQETKDKGATPHSSLLTPHSSLLTLLKLHLVPEQWNLLTLAAEHAEAQGWQLFLVGGAVRDLLLATLQRFSDEYATLADSRSPLNPPILGDFDSSPQNWGARGAKTAVNSQVDAESRLLIEDIDLVVDGFHQAADVGAGVELARSLQALYPQARLEIHGKFQTAALLWHNDPTFKSLWIDIATARTEFYPYPAANPEVEASSIQQDLYRRDFTINALAVRLTPPRAGEMLDFFGGVLDLQSKQIRVLHANSFIEDPTRIYRAVRFAVRLGFQIDAQTEGYIRHAIASGIYQQVQDRNDANPRSAPALQTRLKAELKHVLQAPYWKSALKLLADLDALQCIHPTLKPDRDLWRQLRSTERWLSHVRREELKDEEQTSRTVEKTSTQRNRNISQSSIFNLQSSIFNLPDWLLLLEVILAHLAPEHRVPVAENLQLPAESIERLSDLVSAQTNVEAELGDRHTPSQVVHQLSRYDMTTLLLIAIRSHTRTQNSDKGYSVRKTIWRYLTQWCNIKAPLDGNDLKQLGYKPGRQFRQILDALTTATLDRIITNRADAEEFLEQNYPHGRF